MKLAAGNIAPSEIVLDSMDEGSIILFKYGPGTSGDILLKQLMCAGEKGPHCIYISTHESGDGLQGSFSNMDIRNDMEMVSLVGDMDRATDSISKKDRFRSEGIMVTDLLEISSNSDHENIGRNPGNMLLSRVSSIFQRQVLPFHLVLDSVMDIVDATSVESVMDRLRLLKSAVVSKKGRAVIAAPLNWNVLDPLETTFFDAVFVLSVDNSTGVWKRNLLRKNRKGSFEPPQEWEINVIKDIPEARSL